MVVADNQNLIVSGAPVKRSVAISPLVHSTPSLEEEGNSDMPAVAAGAADLKSQSQSRHNISTHIIHNSSPVRLVVASELTHDPLEDDDNADVSSLEHASDYDMGNEDSPVMTPQRRQSSTGSFSASRFLQITPSYYSSQYGTSVASSHYNGSHLTRTNTESTDVLVSMPTSMEASRQNSDDDDDHHRQFPGSFPHHYHQHHHHHHHHDPSSIQEWTQRRQNHTHQFQLQQPPKQQSPQTAQQDQQDSDINRLTEALEEQQLGCPNPKDNPCDVCDNGSTPGAESENISISSAATEPMAIPKPRVPKSVIASSAASTSSAFSPSLTDSSSRKSSFFSRRKDSKLSRKKSARETSHGIFHDLKRFLKVRSTSPTLSPSHVGSEPSHKASKKSSSKHDNKSHHHHGHHGNCIETDLRKKYGKIGKVIGSGAGGTVRVICRDSDKKSFAIKQFRKRKPNESERAYIKKLTSEYCLGSTFHHPNIIETLDIVQEADNYYEIMEFAKHELFTAVMSGAMGRDEIACCFKGVCNGVTYLHEMGVAHRDLKLDNVVMNERGIVKIIDFGCSMVYQHPFEKKVHMAKGISGSDPYIAPEVFTTDEHDPRLADVWSLGIIFVCMTLRRFPWKLAKKDDTSFEAYCNSSGAGKNRLLKLMPRESRAILSRMLEVNPAKRALMTEVMEDSWVKNIEACTLENSCLYHCHHLGEDPLQVWNPNPKPRFDGRGSAATDDDDNDDDDVVVDNSNSNVVKIDVKAVPSVISTSLVNAQVPVTPVH
ncbi:serine/threonine protein kinase [Entomortierella lignicola]|nr:serine/threonine protein kinase [Entomortierella lignicola]